MKKVTSLVGYYLGLCKGDGTTAVAPPALREKTKGIEDFVLISFLIVK